METDPHPVADNNCDKDWVVVHHSGNYLFFSIFKIVFFLLRYNVLLCVSPLVCVPTQDIVRTKIENEKYIKQSIFFK